MGFNRGSIRRFEQERLAKEDIRLLIECCHYATPQMVELGTATPTRMELLIGKLRRMENAG